MEKALINSLPKAGTNLLGKALEMAGYNQAGHFAPGPYRRNPLLMMQNKISGGQAYLIGVDMPLAVSKSLIEKKLDHLGEGQFVTAHLGYRDDILNELLARKIKPILITRDPRAILSSFVHYVLKEKRHPLHPIFKNLPELDRYNLTLGGTTYGKLELKSLEDRCRSLDPWIKSPEVLKVKFEDLIGERGGGSDSEQSVCLERTFQHLRVDSRATEKVKRNLFGAKTITFRKGQISSWTEEVPPEIQSAARVELGKILDAWGYDN